MSLILGIHVGHHASCTVVQDGNLIAAIQLERLTRRKHHSVLTLSNDLPVAQALAAAGVNIEDVDLIVSSFQGIAQGGFGLHQPLISPGFTLFDPFDPRHYVISHHLAHAHCAAAYAPDGSLAILVSDYAGSSTVNGDDFALPFAEWYAGLIRDTQPIKLKTECLSIYSVDETGFSLHHREFRDAHVAPESAVCSVASLYENITSALLSGHNQHGSLMALAAYGALLAPDDDPGPFLTINGDEVQYRNDWQHKIHDTFVAPLKGSQNGIEHSKAARLAWLCQDATEEALLAYARKAKQVSGSPALAVAGGTFLNILANTRIANSGLYDMVYVPSAPNDAGIAIGCAMWGARKVGSVPHQIVTDRLGQRHQIETAMPVWMASFAQSTRVSPREVAEKLASGWIVARFAGRAEFGPRALGGRSLLGSPLLDANKTRLNNIKGRQQWRPVAPIVIEKELHRFFDGPGYSPWMTFSHTIRPEHQPNLPALHHPDRSTRCQSHRPEQDPWLDEILKQFGDLSGYPILLNTSLNGPDEPIIERPQEAIKWFLLHPDVDALLLDDLLITRLDAESFLLDRHWHIVADAYILIAPSSDKETGVKCVVKGSHATHTLRTAEISESVRRGTGLDYQDLSSLQRTQVADELKELFLKGLITEAVEER